MNNDQSKFTGVDAEISSGAVSLYDQGGAEEFPVLKAFQQYIDAEQAKARKRLMSLGIFFGVLMVAVIAAFVGMLMNISQRNQLLNDRLVEFAMKERDRDRQAPVVVQQPQQQDNSAILALTTKLEEMQKKLSDSQKQVQEAEAAARKAAEAAKGPSPEELEIQRLKALLTAEKEKAAQKAEEEKKMKREIELEAYRRKHYPELYAPQPVKQVKEEAPITRKVTNEDIRDIFDEIDGEPKPVAQKKKIVSEDTAISYFDEEEKKPTTKQKKSVQIEAPKPEPKATESYSIPVDVKGSTSQWQIPE